MAEETGIAWTDSTFNPWIGCTKVSEGCKNCYAENGTAARVSKSRGLPLWGVGSHRQITSALYWKQPAKWNKQAEKSGIRRRVFCASLADIFEDYRGPSECELRSARNRLFQVLKETPYLDWQLLTKRPENIMDMVPQSWRESWPRNVWIGCTVENQKRAEERVPHLLRVPAAVRFLSMEPLLEPIDLDLPRCDTHNRDHVGFDDEAQFCNECAHDGFSGEMSFDHWLDPCASAMQPGINWVIIGGESGPGARPFNPAWADWTVTQCKAAGVPVFVKQMGSNPTLRGGSGWGPIRDSKGGDWSEWPAQLRVREFPNV